MFVCGLMRTNPLYACPCSIAVPTLRLSRRVCSLTSSSLCELAELGSGALSRLTSSTPASEAYAAPESPGHDPVSLALCRSEQRNSRARTDEPRQLRRRVENLVITAADERNPNVGIRGREIRRLRREKSSTSCASSEIPFNAIADAPARDRSRNSARWRPCRPRSSSSSSRSLRCRSSRRRRRCPCCGCVSRPWRDHDRVATVKDARRGLGRERGASPRA